MSDFDLLFTAVVLSLAGTIMIVLRKLKLGNEYVLDSSEWLIIGTAPLIPAVSLVTDDNTKTLFIGGYVSIIVIWGIFSFTNKKFLVGKKTNDLDDDEKRKKARPVILILFVGMIVFVILTYLRIIGKF